jgi:hypothetical protein
VVALSALALLYITSAFGFGIKLHRLFRISCGSDTGDGFFISVWVGLAVMASIAMALALVVPLGPLVWSAVLLAGLIALWSERKLAGASLRALGLGQSAGATFAVLMTMALAAALVASKDISQTDTAAYQLPHMVWFEQYGSVRGLALLHYRFGYNSSWLALIAPAAGVGGEYRFVALGGALIFTLLAFQAACALVRIVATGGRSADWYVLGAVIPMLHRDILAFIVSSTPDLAVYAMIVLAGWIIVSDAERKYSVFAVGLAAGAVAVKISAAPMLAGAFVYAVIADRSVRKTAVAAAFGGILILPVLTANFISSGCIAFPAAFTCLDVAWSVPRDTVSAISVYISQWPLVGGRHEFIADDILDYAQGRVPILTLAERLALLDSVKWELAAAAALCVAVAIGAARRLPRARIVVATAIAGLLYALLVPLYRFAAPWLGLAVGSAFALLPTAERPFRTMRHWLGRLPFTRSPTFLMAATAALIASFAVALNNVSKLGDRELAESGYQGYPTPVWKRLLLPPAVLPREYTRSRGVISGTSFPLSVPLALVEARDHDVVFVRPKVSELCWAAPPPCAPPGEPFNPIKLRDPTRGLAGGLIRPSSDDHD